MIGTLGARVNFIVVSDLLNDTFYAKINIGIDGRDIDIDSRPSDAIAIAVRAKVPIYAEEVVLEKAGIIFDQATGKPMPGTKAANAGGSGEVTEEELRKLSAFSDFINSLDLKDLGKGKAEDDRD
jgi:hypothetical protein